MSNNDGLTFVVKAGTEFEVVSTNDLGERITASPAITGHEMILRTDSHLYCVGRVPKKCASDGPEGGGETTAPGGY